MHALTCSTNQSSYRYNGDLTITLDSGLSVRIPNDQLVVPNLTIDPKSGAINSNTSAPELVINAIQAGNADDLPQLGRQFLSAAYLMVNQDSNEFTLWKANPTASEDIVAVNSENKVVQEFCSTTGDGKSTTNPDSAKTSDAGPNPVVVKKTLATGAIVGIAIAGVALLAALALLAFWLIRRRKKTMKAAELSGVGGPSEAAAMMDGRNSFNHHIPSELYSAPATAGEFYKPMASPPQELASKPAARPDQHYELSSEPVHSYR